MGCDGGTIPRRDELVRTAKKPEQKDKDAERQFRWLHCALTQERLQQPIVMCGLGRLYSKQNIIEALLDKEKKPDIISHINSLKDIKDLNLTSNPAFTDGDKTEGLLDPRNAPFICKLIGIEMSGKFRFIALWSCGCAFSERAFKQIQSNVCPLCQVSYTEEDVIILNGTEEEIGQMQKKMDNRIAKRKTKKSKKCPETTVSTSTDQSRNSEVMKHSHIVNATSTNENLSKPNAVTKKIKYSESLKRNLDINKFEDPELKKIKTESVAKNPKASEVYKSLFTSHSSESKQDRAHWVTYNPFYN